LISKPLTSLITKQFISILTDKRILYTNLLSPFILFFVLSYGVTLELKEVSVAVYNQDSGKHGFEIIQRLKGSPYFSDVIVAGSEAGLTKAIENEHAILGISFPSDFSRKISQGESGPMQLIQDGRHSNSSSIAGTYINDIVDTYNRELISKVPVKKEQSIIVPRNWFNPNLLYIWFTVPSLIGLLGMVIALNLSNTSITAEKEMGTLELLRVSPIKPYQVLIGKAIPALIIAIAITTILLIEAIFFYGIEFQGSFLLLYASLIVFLFAIVGLGLMMSSLASRLQQVGIFSFLFISPSNNVSGFVSPVENMPIWLQYIAEFIPLKHFLIVARGVFLKDINAQVVFDHTWPNILIGIVTISLATIIYKKKIE
jgi:ABC-2 type transport system permease protein